MNGEFDVRGVSLGVLVGSIVVAVSYIAVSGFLSATGRAQVTPLDALPLLLLALSAALAGRELLRGRPA